VLILLILWGEFVIEWREFTNFVAWVITFILETFLLTTKYVLIISNHRNYAITIHYRFPPLFTLTLHYVASMFFIRFGNLEGCCNLLWRWGKTPNKIRGIIPNFNNSKLFWKRYAYTVQRTKSYLFYCCVFHIYCIFVSKNEDHIINLFCIFRQYEQQALPHKDTIFVPLHTGLLEKWNCD